MSKCSAPNCTNSQRTDSDEQQFYEFPSDPDLRTQWISNVGRPNWTPGRRSVICSAHFERTQFKTIDQSTLVDSAVPTLFQTSRMRKGEMKRNVRLERGLKSFREVSYQPKECSSLSRKQISTVVEEPQTSSCEQPTDHSCQLKDRVSTGDFCSQFIFLNDANSLKDCQVVSNHFQDQSNNYMEVSIDDAAKFDRGSKTVTIVDEDTLAPGDIMHVEPNISSDGFPEIFEVPEISQVRSDSIIFIQHTTEEPTTDYKEVPNLSNSSTACSRICQDGSHTELHVQENSRAKIKKKIHLKKQSQNDFLLLDEPSSLFVEKSVAPSEVNNTSESIMAESSIPGSPEGALSGFPASTLFVEKSVVDLAMSLENHKQAKFSRKLIHSSSKWQDGTFMCRLCGVASNKTVNLFSAEASEAKLRERISSFLPIMIVYGDVLPQSVCSKCLNRLDLCSEMIVNSFNTQKQLASVINKDVEQLSEMTVFLHRKKKKSLHSADLKRHILLMEIHHEKDKSIEEYFSIAYDDLHIRLNPKASGGVETQCNLILAAITENCCVSEVEQVRTAAEVLISNAKTQEEMNDETEELQETQIDPDVLECDANTLELSDDASYSEPTSSFEPAEYHEFNPSEAQAMPFVDTVSPSEFNAANARTCKSRSKEMDFTNLQNMIRWHVVKDGEVRPTCSLCNQRFESQFNIKQHIESHLKAQENLGLALDCMHSRSSKEWNLKCKRFYSPWFQCSYCSERCQSRPALKQHLQQHHAANAKCKACGHEASDICASTLHRQTCPKLKNGKEWRCRKCLESFPGQRELVLHQGITGHDNEVPSWLCDICGKRYLQAAKLNQHKKSHLPPEFKYIHQCIHCPKRYINSSRLREHMQKHEEKKYMCKVCGKLFSTKQILRQHEFTHGDPHFLCSLCSRTFFRKSHLLKHMNVHNPENTRASRAGPQPHRDGLNRCRECKEVFDSKELLSHYKVSHPQIPLLNYVCDICKEENTSYAELFQHQREAHKTGVKDCPFCDKTIDSSTQMKYHLMRHEGMFPYNCPMCSNGYTANSVLQDHIRRKHTGEKPYECYQCSKSFPTNGALSQHSTVHSLPHQLLPCPICDQGFKRKAHLDIHLRTHTGEKPYPCPICDRPFRQRPDCIKHIRVIHSEDPSKFNIRYHPNMSTSFPQVVSVADMELILEGEDLMQTALDTHQVLLNP